MWNDNANYKRIIRNVIAIIILIFALFNFGFKVHDVANSKTVDENLELEEEFSDNVENILSEIDTNELDDYLNNDFNLDFFDVGDFKELISKVLNGNYFSNYDTLLNTIKEFIKNEFKSLLKIFLVFLVITFLFELFNNLCVTKYDDFKKVVKLIFSIIIAILVVFLFKQISADVLKVVSKIFSFSKIIFPILLSLILLSGSVGTHSVYSSLSLFLLNSGSYLFTYILIPIATSIFILTLAGSAFSNKKFSRILDIFKSIFKYSIIIFFTIFGLFSSINIITSSVKDGVSVRLTKYAIKNYIPIVGGYVSQGFDFVHSCSVVVKNAFGVCGIFVLLFIVLKPVLLCFVYCFLFKLLSAVVALIGNTSYSDLFNNVSKSLSYFIVVLVGLFFLIFVFIYLLIISVSVI